MANLVYFLALLSFFTPVISSSTQSVDCTSLPQANYPFCNPTLSPEDRATDLVSRLTDDELYSQCAANAKAIPRLGIKDYNWRSNCLHGWALSGGDWPEGITWTVFPTPLGLGATFDIDLIQKIGEITADEGRALHNIMLAKFNGSSTEAAGLNCFSPNVNLFRDPRWGRGKETFSEDPYHLSLMGVAYTKGLQEGKDPQYLKIAACAKHFAVHSGPEDIRNSFSANISLHDLYDTFLPAFKSQSIAAKVAQIMPALSGTRTIFQEDGAPDAANPFLLKTVLRTEFNRPLISTISDNGAIGQVYTTHHYVPSLVLAAAVCMNATTDLDLIYDDVYTNYLPSAVSEGYVHMTTIKEAVWRSFYLRIRVGDFDPYESVSYQHIDASHLDTKENAETNLLSVQESIVLLKNAQNTLPIDPLKVKKLAVVGPLANATNTLLSNYVGIPSTITSILSGISNFINNLSANTLVTYGSGCIDPACPNTTGFHDALIAAQGADYVIAVMGLDDTLEGEGHDRKNTICLNDTKVDVLNIPGCQSSLLTLLLETNPNIILILINGGPLSIPELYNDEGVLAIIEAFYPGPLGGVALADVLFGQYNPAGRMPVTTLISSSDLRDSEDYHMSPKPGRTYRYFQGQTLFPFGYGLSYTNFTYSNVYLFPSDNIKACETINMKVSVINSGEVAGDEVVQVYIIYPQINDLEHPHIQLVGFKRVKQMKPSQNVSIEFKISPYLMSLVDSNGMRYIYSGQYMLSIGGRSPGNALIGEDTNVMVSFSIIGNEPVPVDSCENVPSCLAC